MGKNPLQLLKDMRLRPFKMIQPEIVPVEIVKGKKKAGKK